VLRKATITNWEPNTKGAFYRVKVRAINREGYDDSPYLLLMNSGHPLPVLTPVELLSQTDQSLKVAMPIVTDDESVSSYEL
jgi:hypothetical protein